MRKTQYSGQSELKPCPMCSATPKLIVGFSPLVHAFVDCECGMQTELKDTADEVVAMWNRRAAASAHTIGEDAYQADDAPLTGDIHSRVHRALMAAHPNLAREFAEARAALTAEKVAGPVAVYPQGVMGIPPYSPPGSGSITVETGLSWNTAPQQPSQPVAQTPALTDEQREAVEYAVRWMDENVSNRYAHTAAKELRALLAAPPVSQEAKEEHVTLASEPAFNRLAGVSGISRGIAEQAFAHGAPTVEVYSGKRTVFFSLASFIEWMNKQ